MIKMIRNASATVASVMTIVALAVTRKLADDRGDVPGWVLVTVMTAGLVTGLWVVADEQLSSLLSRAITAVSG